MWGVTSSHHFQPHDLVFTSSVFARHAAKLADVGVSSVSWRVIAAISRRGPLRPREIASLEQVSRPTATIFLQRLEKKGLLQRAVDPEDSRSVLFDLTDQGREALSTWRVSLDGALAPRLQKLSEKDITTLIEAQNLMQRIIAEEN